MLIKSKEDALKHFRAVQMATGITFSDPVAYFTAGIARIKDKLTRERALDPQGAEMTQIREWMTVAEYFEWLEGVLEHQEAYLAALQA